MQLGAAGLISANGITRHTVSQTPKSRSCPWFFYFPNSPIPTLYPSYHQIFHLSGISVLLALSCGTVIIEAYICSCLDDSSSPSWSHCHHPSRVILFCCCSFIKYFKSDLLKMWFSEPCGTELQLETSVWTQTYLDIIFRHQYELIYTQINRCVCELLHIYVF